VLVFIELYWDASIHMNVQIPCMWVGGFVCGVLFFEVNTFLVNLSSASHISLHSPSFMVILAAFSVE